MIGAASLRGLYTHCTYLPCNLPNAGAPQWPRPLPAVELLQPTVYAWYLLTRIYIEVASRRTPLGWGPVGRVGRVRSAGNPVGTGQVLLRRYTFKCVPPSVEYPTKVPLVCTKSANEKRVPSLQSCESLVSQTLPQTLGQPHSSTSTNTRNSTAS